MGQKCWLELHLLVKVVQIQTFQVLSNNNFTTYFFFLKKSLVIFALNYLGVYARVTSVLDWILDNTDVRQASNCQESGGAQNIGNESKWYIKK